MKLIEPSVDFHGELQTDYKNSVLFMEACGRLCYKSEDKITEVSAEPFIKRLIKAGHLAMIEHSNFVVKRNVAEIPEDVLDTTAQMIGKYLNHVLIGGAMYIGGNLTAWYQRYYAIPGLRMSFTAPFCEVFGELFGLNSLGALPTGWEVCPHEEIPKELRRYSGTFVVDRGVSHELVRHRPCSFAQESTRYVDYMGRDMAFVKPFGFDTWTEVNQKGFIAACTYSQRIYKMLRKNGLLPQQARAVLPNALKTEIVVTADAKEWQHIKSLRTAPAAHPDMVAVMDMVPWDKIEA
jgi:thymidylate synthase (FAD)